MSQADAIDRTRVPASMLQPNPDPSRRAQRRRLKAGACVKTSPAYPPGRETRIPPVPSKLMPDQVRETARCEPMVDDLVSEVDVVTESPRQVSEKEVVCEVVRNGRKASDRGENGAPNQDAGAHGEGHALDLARDEHLTLKLDGEAHRVESAREAAALPNGRDT